MNGSVAAELLVAGKRTSTWVLLACGPARARLRLRRPVCGVPDDASSQSLTDVLPEGLVGTLRWASRSSEACSR